MRHPQAERLRGGGSGIARHTFRRSLGFGLLLRLAGAPDYQSTDRPNYWNHPDCHDHAAAFTRPR